MEECTPCKVIEYARRCSHSKPEYTKCTCNSTQLTDKEVDSYISDTIKEYVSYLDTYDEYIAYGAARNILHKNVQNTDKKEELDNLHEYISQIIRDIHYGIQGADLSLKDSIGPIRYYLTLGSEVEFDLDINGKRVKFTVNADKHLK